LPISPSFQLFLLERDVIFNLLFAVLDHFPCPTPVLTHHGPFTTGFLFFQVSFLPLSPNERAAIPPLFSPESSHVGLFNAVWIRVWIYELCSLLASQIFLQAEDMAFLTAKKGSPLMESTDYGWPLFLPLFPCVESLFVVFPFVPFISRSRRFHAA